MKINIQTNYNVYKNRPSDSTGISSGHGAASGPARTDRNAIVRGSTSLGDRQMLTLKSSVQDYVSAPAEQDRIGAIRAQVQDGSYHIPTSDLVNAIILDN